MRRKVLTLLGIVLVLALGAFFYVGAHIEGFLNRVEPVPLPVVSDAARRLQASSFVVDMHADSLLYGRDLLQRSAVGHVDLPRLQEGGVGLQFFTAATKVPLGFNIERTDGNRLDLLTVAGLAQLEPRFISGPYERALLQAERLQDFIARSHGQLVPVRTVAELDALMQHRAAAQNSPPPWPLPATGEGQGGGQGRGIGGLLGIEGAHALVGDPANVATMFAAGFRMIGPAHFFDNEFAGSAHGMEKYGLTDKGRQMVRRMQELGMLVDLAHSSTQTIDDVLAIATQPVVVSHGGVRGTCDNARNLSDDHVRGIARTGGVIGIGYWDTAVCGTEMRAITAAMRHVMQLVGDDFVALGSDFDGATAPGFDTSQLPALTQQMLNDGFAEASIRKILGANAVRVLRQVLPAGARVRE